MFSMQHQIKTEECKLILNLHIISFVKLEVIKSKVINLGSCGGGLTRCAGSFSRRNWVNGIITNRIGVFRKEMLNFIHRRIRKEYEKEKNILCVFSASSRLCVQYLYRFGTSMILLIK